MASFHHYALGISFSALYLPQFFLVLGKAVKVVPRLDYKAALAALLDDNASCLVSGGAKGADSIWSGMLQNSSFFQSKKCLPRSATSVCTQNRTPSIYNELQGTHSSFWTSGRDYF
jgi:hypothetical protein